MIEVNEQMTWEEAYKRFPNKRIMVTVQERLKPIKGYRPTLMFVKKVIESRNDFELAAKEIDDGGYIDETFVLPDDNGDYDRMEIGGVSF